MERHDIQTAADIQLLVDSFYKQVLPDPLIGYIFADIAQLSWEKHIPIMYQFWGSILLGKGTYEGNPMSPHIALDKKVKLEPAHFKRWLQLWEATVQEHFNGPVATDAIKRAKNIAALMQYKIEQNRV
ncbi:MAG: hypothetical protein RLZZ316_1899 [Bacteroidota bacterium]|jgi:hemoglobin